ncbi:MAG: CDP-glucose 4,6-dehydratase [Trichloromonadaceae bacterium]
MNEAFWLGKRVFVTGHTGFKGSWLCLWLHRLGASVTGYALEPPTEPNLFSQARVAEHLVTSQIGDVRSLENLNAALHTARPEIVFHLAAQPLVRDSYRIPVETYSTNVMGTVHLLESVRRCQTVRAMVNVTTDKCYENREWVWGYREDEAMGGYDPYSSSKGCAELVSSAWRRSFFQNETAPALATARAGNVIGGGDWAADRLIPDMMRAVLSGEAVRIRNPNAIRPWQHVLEPLSGYLKLAETLYSEGASFAEGWNFGPRDEDARPVEWIVQHLCELWGNEAHYEIDAGDHPHEAHFLKLDCSKAHMRLGWKPRWNLSEALELIVNWTREYQAGGDLRHCCLSQIEQYEKTIQEKI